MSGSKQINVYNYYNKMPGYFIYKMRMAIKTQSHMHSTDGLAPYTIGTYIPFDYVTYLTMYVTIVVHIVMGRFLMMFQFASGLIIKVDAD